jgi:hypothetical protein
MKNLCIKPLLYGLSSYTPVFSRKSTDRKYGTGGTDSARYCYSVWLRHLVVLFKNGMTEVPNVIAELGPGDSIGIGTAALLSGSNQYNAFDVVEYSSKEMNIKIFNNLVDLFRRRENIPDDSEFPGVKPKLDSYIFPEYILTNDIIEALLSKDRLDAIMMAVTNYGNHGPVSIQYCVPWYNYHNISDKSVDLIYSQAALEHVDDLLATYKSMYKWLTPKGFMSHQIDFRCHGTAKHWNGHWAYSDFLWALIKGRRPYLLNREPYSTHVMLQAKVGFKVLCSIRVNSDNGNPGINRADLSKRFMCMSDDDLSTSTAHIISVKQ